MTTTAKELNKEYLDLYGDIFEEGIILTEAPTFETIQKYFKENKSYDYNYNRRW